MDDVTTVTDLTSPPQGRSRARQRTGSLVDEAYRKILTMITQDALTVGERLPSEGDLALRIGVSRPVVRQALSRLQHSGVVKVRWGAGTYVQNPQGQQHEGPSFGPVRSLGEVRQAYDFRMAIEGEAASLAARCRTDQSLAALRLALEQLDKTLATSSASTQADLDFHLAVAVATGNPFFERALRSIQQSAEFSIGLARTLSLTHPHERLAIVQQEHVSVVLAIETGKAEEANEAMRNHLSNACRRLFQGPGE